MQNIPFIGGSYTLPSINVDQQKSLNLYPEIVQSGSGKSNVILKKRSGLKLFTTVTNPIREGGLYKSSKGRLFAVNGNRFDEISAAGGVTARGTINTTTGSVRVADNGNELIIVDGNTGFIFNTVSNSFNSIIDTDFPDEATHITFLGSYFIVNAPNSAPIGKFFVSGVFDGTSWNSLDFGNAEASPDELTALIANGNNLFALGPQSIQTFYNSGNADFPFDPISGAVSEIGILAPYSLSKMDTNIFWLGANDQGFSQVFTNQGVIPQRISNHALEQEFSGYADLELTTGFCFQETGHKFYVLSFPSANRTWAFDTTTGEWHQLAYTDYLLNVDGLYRGNTYAFFNNKNYVSDYANGNIYEIDPNTFTDDGNKIKCLRRSPHLWDGLDRTFISSFQVDMETGRGLTGTRTSRTGTISTSNGSTAVVGTSTLFTTELTIGDEIRWVDNSTTNQSGIIMTITDNTNLILQSNSTSVSSLVSYATFDSSGVTPLAMLRWSIDGGHTYGNEHTVPIGPIGAYRTRAKWNRLGASRDRIFEFAVTDPISLTLIGAFLEAA